MKIFKALQHFLIVKKKLKRLGFVNLLSYFCHQPAEIFPNIYN